MLLLVRMLHWLLLMLLRSVETTTIRLLLEGRVVGSMMVIGCNGGGQGEGVERRASAP